MALELFKRIYFSIVLELWDWLTTIKSGKKLVGARAGGVGIFLKRSFGASRDAEPWRQRCTGFGYTMPSASID